MKTDSLDRFGTRLESRFTKLEIKQMMINAGLTSIKFSNNQPYWVAVGHKSKLSNLFTFSKDLILKMVIIQL